jgi:Flp pilus assembly protein TadG
MRGDVGQDLLEAAMILPVLLLILLGIMEFAIIIFSYDSVANAAREGARFGIVHPNDAAGIEAAARASASGLDPAALQVIIPPPGNQTVRVTVTYRHDLLTGPVIDAIGGNPEVLLSSEAIMVREQ